MVFVMFLDIQSKIDPLCKFENLKNIVQFINEDYGNINLVKIARILDTDKKSNTEPIFLDIKNLSGKFLIHILSKVGKEYESVFLNALEKSVNDAKNSGCRIIICPCIKKKCEIGNFYYIEQFLDFNKGKVFFSHQITKFFLQNYLTMNLVSSEEEFYTGLSNLEYIKYLEKNRPKIIKSIRDHYNNSNLDYESRLDLMLRNLNVISDENFVSFLMRHIKMSRDKASYIVNQKYLKSEI
jgi:hypothetical protein